MPITLLQQWHTAFKRNAPDVLAGSAANGSNTKGQQVLNSFRDTNVAFFADAAITSDSPMPAARQFTYLGSIYELFRLTGSNVGKGSIADNSLSNVASQRDLINGSTFFKAADKVEQIEQNSRIYNSGEIVEGAVMENMVRNNFRFGDAEGNSRRWKNFTEQMASNTKEGIGGRKIAATDSLDEFSNVGNR